MKLIRCLLLCSMALLPYCLYAQQMPEVSGRLKNPAGQAVPGATVTLLQAADSMLVKAAVASGQGRFRLPVQQPGIYRIAVTYIGYAAYYSDTLQLYASRVLPDITLQPAAATQLKDVQVTARKPFVETRIDRTIVNVDALISNAGTSALDVLEKSPGVLVDQDGNISLLGKSGVTVYIDDKPTYLSGSQLAAYLRSLPSGTLEAIELMPVPPARYDAAGNAGVINIRTKKLKQRGFNGNLSTTYGQGFYPKNFNSLNLNFRNNAFNYFVSAGYSYNHNFSDLLITRSIRNDDGSPRSYFNQFSYINRYNRSPSLKTGMDYYMDKNTTIGVALNGSYYKATGLVTNNSSLYSPVHTLDSLVTAHNRDVRTFKRGAANLNYRHQYGNTGRTLGVDLDYIRNQSQTDQLFQNASYYADSTLKGKDQLNGSIPSAINIYSVKADYTHPLQKSAKIEGGVKASYINTDNQADYSVTIEDITAPDYDKTNHFLYKEHINAAYINFSKEWAKFSLQTGLRLENTIMQGRQLGNAVKSDSAFKRNYTNLFPTVYLSYKTDSAAVHQFILSYSKRIERPGFNDLNPFISPLDKFMYYVGNPFLQPVISHSLDLSWVYRNELTIKLNYSHYTGEQGETIEARGDRFYSRPANVGNSNYVSLSANANLQPLKWLTLHWFGIGEYARFKGNLYGNVLDVDGMNYVTNITLQGKLSGTWNAELQGLYRGRITALQFVLGDFWAVGCALEKKILQKKGSLKLSVNDIFYSRLNYGDINNLTNATGHYRNKGDSRVAQLTFTYNFGKTYEKRSRSTGGADAEEQRIR
ncbi:MAG TPA: outer membrane beta-barrel protein [Chitinophaga sp.]|uniref:outer membrane beta-barrel protein n=1 Tax=Chitinophaga sp. TaxID=1869181 RepID=UPI002DB8D8F4|nr:outer membrane beta-barrel protein [Chitinophaga sp.]HEU4553860.1 outer membrane beta-barrel protein [Chitinophaga sp.]